MAGGDRCGTSRGLLVSRRFDGVDALPEGITGVDGYGLLLEELARRGWSAADLAGLAGANVLRVLSAIHVTAEEVGEQLAKRGTPMNSTRVSLCLTVLIRLMYVSYTGTRNLGYYAITAWGEDALALLPDTDTPFAAAPTA